MKKHALLLPFIFIAPQVLALNAQDEQDYKTHYMEQMKPLVVQKLSTDNATMSAQEVNTQASAYVVKMADCQLTAMKHYPEKYREKAILPVAQGKDLITANRELETVIKADIESGNITKEEVITMAQKAQKKAESCATS